MNKILFNFILFLCLAGALPLVQAQNLSYISKDTKMAYSAVNQLNKVAKEPPSGESLVSFLNKVERAYKVKFIYENEKVEHKRVDSNWQPGSSLNSLLKKKLGAQGLQFKRMGGTQIVIYPKVKLRKDIPQIGISTKDKLTKEINPSLLELPAQTVVSGQVRDSLGEPLPGVTIFVKDDKSIGTSTDINGRYVIEVPDDAVLVFSMVRSEEHTSELQ